MSIDLKDMPIEKDLHENIRTKNNSEKNSDVIINLLKLIAYVILLTSIIAGIIMMSEIQIVFGLTTIFGGIIFSILILGFAHVISLLTDIRENTREKSIISSEDVKKP